MPILRVHIIATYHIDYGHSIYSDWKQITLTACLKHYFNFMIIGRNSIECLLPWPDHQGAQDILKVIYRS